MRKFLLILFISLFTTCMAFAQVTTGSISGVIKDTKGETLPGATVVATHVPSGSVYSTVTGANGQFTIPNMRVGGPYTVKITYIGFNPRSFDDLTVTLGDPLKMDIKLEDSSHALQAVNITSNKNAVISPERTGASTHIGQRDLQSLPSVTRSVQDFARLTPQAIPSSSGTDGTPLGITFAGQNNRYNQFSIDGANATDAFGLASSGTNGGLSGVNPIPLEAIQEVQILLSPYDVTQGGFTGGGINAVTKSGTNSIHGSAYYFLQNQSFVGKNVLTQLPYQTFKNNTFGASLGGPIIKNKLFYFVDYERNESTTPIAFDPSQAGSGSNFDVNLLSGLRNFLITKYNYDPGSYTNINKTISSNSVFGRIDWNINDKNKLTFRQSYVQGSNYVISRTANAITFSDGGYYINNTTNSSVLELNSSISSHASNVFRITFNNIQDARSTSPFPNVQIVSNGLTYNFGADFSSAANQLTQNNYTITDNFTIYKGKHTFTFGTDDEFFNTSNVFQQAYNGAYTYSTSNTDNIAAFENNTTAPNAYTLNYTPTNPGDKFAAKMHVAQLGIYGQDVYAVNDGLKLTYGLRIDLPAYFNKPTDNPKFDSDPAFAGLSNSTTPKSVPLFSPRIGFNYDVNGNGETQLRGGAGLFTGRTPFVWISNAYTNNGINTVKYTTIPPTLRFPNSPAAINSNLSGAYVPPSATFPTSEIDVTSPNFKVPQTLRGNLAIDQKLPFWGLIGTVEGIYTKTINNVNYDNLNVGPQVGSVQVGSSERPFYNFTRVSSNFTDVLELTNTSKGYAYNLTAQVQKPIEHGWAGMLAYTFGESFSLNDGTSSTAISNWRFVDNVNGLNNPDLARANYDPGSRIIAYVSKTFKYLNNKLATTVGVVYSGQSGTPFSYTYNKNINGDDATGKNVANENADLMYIPSEAELSNPTGYLNYKIVDLTSTTGTTTTVVRTAPQEWADLANFIHSQQSLTKNEGNIAARNTDRTPWENHFDLKLTQDFYLVKQHKISVSMDILNVGNLLNKNWGWSYFVSNQTASPLTVVAIPAATTTGGVTTVSQPTFTFDQTKLNLINGTYRPYNVNDYTSRWRGQLSIHYSF